MTKVLYLLFYWSYWLEIFNKNWTSQTFKNKDLVFFSTQAPPRPLDLQNKKQINIIRTVERWYDFKFWPDTQCLKGFLWVQNGRPVSKAVEGVTKNRQDWPKKMANIGIFAKWLRVMTLTFHQRVTAWRAFYEHQNGGLMIRVA